MKTQAPLWQPCKWPYNDAPEYQAWTCYRRAHGKRNCVILYPCPPRSGEWSYVASFGGRNDDRSHSGGFPDGFTLDQAKECIEIMTQCGKFGHSLCSAVITNILLN